MSPALGAQDRAAPPRSLSIGIESGIGSFTPASADPQLAAVLARSGLTANGFRFTPSEASKESQHRVTVAVNKRISRSSDESNARTVAPASTVSVAPIAYNLGVAVGWKRFALSGDVTHVDLGGKPGSVQSIDMGLSYTGRRASGRVKATSTRPLADTPRLIADDPSYSIDVGGSYSLTRNLDVTAGVRYKAEHDRDRLQRLADDRHDSQAVYIGTAFRF
ncbi:hypothetical protein ACFO8O_09220 [Hephaestia sp. GCM10023244]|uniref:hypothetical protein n=1 Tax=unclassified Hephaestia TaxID=2631281 RepID=UPI00336BD36A